MNAFDYAPAPFWILNHRLERAEMARQIKLIKDSGSSGFFLHARDGMLTPYGSKEWFDCVKFAVDEAKKHGMKAWLYDEDAWPSGNAGGLITAQYPEVIAKTLVIKKLVPDEKGIVKASLGQGRVFAAVEILRDENGRIVEVSDVADEIGSVRELFFRMECDYSHVRKNNEFHHVRAGTYFPDLTLERECDATRGEISIYAALICARECGSRFIAPADNLNPKCVDKFIESTHEKYAELLAPDFGGAVPGIFMDEPWSGNPPWADPKSPPWTDAVEGLFLERNGKPLKDVFFHLVENLDSSSRKVRRDYWSLLSELFENSFFKKIGAWCEKHSLSFCGHMVAEEDPMAQVVGAGNVFRCMRHLAIPSFDHITTTIADRNYPALNFGGKLVSSAASWYGKPTVLCECFAISHFNLSPFEMRKIASWLFSLGINWLVPAQFHYSYDGYRKDDAGKSFFFQDPDFKSFPAFAKFAGNLGRELANGVHDAKTILVCPLEAFMEFAIAEEEFSKKLRSRLFELMNSMMEAHIEFAIVDDGELLSAKIENGRICSGFGEFDCVVIPSVDGISPEYLNRFDRLKSAGVDVIVNPALEEIISSGAIATEIGSLAGGSAADIYSRRLKRGNETILYLFNNSSMASKLEIKTPEGASEAYVCDPDSGKLFALEASAKGRVGISIGGYSPMLLEFSSAAMKCDGGWTESGLVDAPPETPPEWNYTPPLDGLRASIGSWDVEIEGAGRKFSAKGAPFGLIRDFAGTDLAYIARRHARPGMDKAPCHEARFDAEYSADFELPEAGAHLLLFESETFAGDWRLEVNGVEIDKSSARREFHYDFMNLVLPVELRKRNRIVVSWRDADEFAGLRSALHVLRRIV